MVSSAKSQRVAGLDSPSNGGESAIDIATPFRVEVTVRGVAPLLFHGWNVEAVEEKSKAAKGSKAKKTDDIESYVYRNDKGELCIPGSYLHGALCNAGRSMQDPRSPRKSARDLFKAVVLTLTPMASLGTKEWDFIDKRRVVVQRNAITRSRPAMFEGWTATFVLLLASPEYIGETVLSQALSIAGRQVGLGDFRPTYGRFEVVSFKMLLD